MKATSKPNEIRFLTDSTEDKDGAKEVIMDYVISWTLRNAQKLRKDDKPDKCILYNYCRKFLSYLLGIELNNDDLVEVKTWKQYCRIDLWVYVKINNDIEYDILIEDKYYTGIHDNQLLRYKEQFDEWLDINRPKEPKDNRKYWLLTCHEKGLTNIYDSGLPEGFQIAYWDEMISKMGCGDKSANDSESDIFNEFWMRSW